MTSRCLIFQLIAIRFDLIVINFNLILINPVLFQLSYPFLKKLALIA